MIKPEVAERCLDVKRKVQERRMGVQNMWRGNVPKGNRESRHTERESTTRDFAQRSDDGELAKVVAFVER